MKKLVLTFFALASIAASVSAQKLEDGIKALYYEKYKTAKSILEKKGGGDKAKKGDEIYWYGQALIQDPGDPSGIESAKKLYSDALARGVNDPYILVGLGEIDILTNNDVAAAKQKFEQAATSSKNDPAILDAIGRANAAGPKSYGDPTYAIELLKKAAAADAKNPDIDVNLALNYLKLGGTNGGPAVEALMDATTRDEKYAKAFYEIGKIYGAQRNYDAMNEWFGKALQADDAYGPTYFGWYLSAKRSKDMEGAQEYLKKFIERTDNDCNSQYYLADLQFQSKKYDEALASAQAMSTGECSTFPFSNLLLAKVYEAKSDNANAQTAISKYFAAVPASSVSGEDYALAGKIYKGTPDSSVVFYAKAFEKDTSIYDKVDHADTLINSFTRLEKPVEKYKWTKKRFYLIPAKYINNLELYNLGEAARIAAPLTKEPADFALADSAFKEYKTKYPNEVYGYAGRAANAMAADTTYKQALEPVSEYITFLEKDKATNKDKLVYYYDVLGQYYANTANDYDAAEKEFKSVLELDPTNDRATKILAQLEKIKASKAEASQATETQDSTTTTTTTTSSSN
ncbi:tetratricopeptide repeat protein [Rhizosphaericola mali]|uniref:Tetratricopeptide repeat protein n=1 Tax=Rhizosphaericola mali TaxID=2545455 RepID=A0A5P2G5V1_9BACT|nr:hypothetical protein [Rhizosphaericola mali]QES90637.1 hypothetical protein E0W69_018910 [Rhizosphaericola mali]